MYSVLTFLMLFVVFCIQEFIAPFGESFFHAQIMLFQIWFTCTAVTLSYPVMLVSAFFAGGLWDLRYVVDVGVIESGVAVSGDMSFGMSILIYGLIGCVMQGIRPLYLRGRLVMPCLVAGVCVLLLRLLDYLFINFKRGGLIFPRELFVEMCASTLVTLVLAPLVLLTLHWLTRAAGSAYRLQDAGY